MQEKISQVLDSLSRSQSCSTIFGKVLIVTSSNSLLTTTHFLSILCRRIQNIHFDLLVIAMWLSKMPELQNLFKTMEEDLISDIMDPVGVSFVTNAKWWWWVKNWKSLNFPKLHCSTCILVLDSVRILKFTLCHSCAAEDRSIHNSSPEYFHFIPWANNFQPSAAEKPVNC